MMLGTRYVFTKSLGFPVLIIVQNTGAAAQQDNGIYNDPFTTMSSVGQGLPPPAPFNPYAGDPNAMAGAGTPFFAQQFSSGPIQPPNYHLYQPYDSYRQDLQPWQRSTYDFFLPEKIREDLQKKAFATQMVLPSEFRYPAWKPYH